MTSRLLVNKIEAKSGSQIDMSTHTLKMPSGHVVQTIQFTADEQTISAGSGNTIINSTFNPKFSGSKFIVSAFIPNCTATSGGSVLVQGRLGTSATPNSNTLIFDCQERMEGTGADDTRGINLHDFGTFTSSGTGTHYVALVLTPDHSTVVARHSTKVKVIVQEVAQ